MLMIQRERSGAPRILLVTVIVGLIVTSLYAGLTALTPASGVAALTGRTGDETMKKLKAVPTGTSDRLYIPKINVDIAINTGASSTTLDKGAWQRTPITGDPLAGGNFALGARRFMMGLTPQSTAEQSPFYHINTLEKGDQLVVDYKGTRYGYVVAKVSHDASLVGDTQAPSTEPKLTLYSVTPSGEPDAQAVIEATPMSDVVYRSH